MSEGPPGYVLREPLGEGSAAVVWRAEPSGSPGRVVAVKRLRGPADPSAVADLRREADALERLSHPSILRLLDVVADGDGVALVLPYAPGGSLAGWIAAEPDGLDPATVADLGARLGGALAAAHNLGLVHRDVKPANVLFDAEAQPLLADFGTARLLGDRTEIAGTAEYLAPEVAAGAPPDARSDVYGLGVTCYEALTGTPPYAGSTPRATLRAAERGHHVPLRDVIDAPAALCDAVEAAISRDPADRPATAADLAGRLDEAARRLHADDGLPPPPPSRAAGTLGATSGAVPPADTTTGAPTAGPSATDAPVARGASGASGAPTAGSAAPAAGSAHGAERSGTQLFGPAPPRPTAPSPQRSGVDRRLLVAAAALVVLLPVGVVWWLVAGGGDDVPPPEPPAESRAEAASVERTPTAPCEDVEAPAEAQDDDAEVLPADVAGRGCTVPVVWDGRTLTVPRADGVPRRYELDAEVGDRLLFGDWTCDDHETPALYRPDSGQVFLFEGFADDEEVTVVGEPTGVVDGRARVLVDEAGCHRIDVE